MRKVFLLNSNLNNFQIDFQSFEDLVIDEKSMSFNNKYVLIAAKLDIIGEDMELLQKIKSILSNDKSAFENSIGILYVESLDNLGTKDFARRVIHLLNSYGMRFISNPLVECIKDCYNLRKWSKNLKLSLNETRKYLLETNIKRLSQYQEINIVPKLLVLHANNRLSRSNTQLLFEMVKQHLKIPYEVIHVEDGTIADCNGCDFKTCLFFGQNGKCYYEGIMVDKIIPSIKESTGILILVPNYNDNVSAKIMALINRLTVMYRQEPNNYRNLFSIIVSGNSGSDLVAKALIGSLNINKNFLLPPRFYLEEIANDFGEIQEIENIQMKSKEFAIHINNMMEKK
jgi:multimeric flavodoxin WrbA